VQPRTMSASGGLVFEGCAARFKAEYIDRTPDIQGSAAALGTVDHEVLETWITNGDHILASDFSLMSSYYDLSYYKHFSSPDRYAEGLDMLKKWYDRQDWLGRKVLSTEVKETFDLPSPDKSSTVPFTYIWDRCDEWDDGTIEVVDYKTVALPIQPEDLKQKIQPRAYALAAQIKYPNATRILVTYDLLRYDRVGAYFSREENVATWHYLRGLYQRVLDSDGTEETLNTECRWCVRKPICTTLTDHAAGGGILGIDNPHEAAELRTKYDSARRALQSLIDDLDDLILTHCETEGITEFATPTTAVKISASSRRKVESERAAKVLGPELMQKYGKIGVTDVDFIIKNEDLSDDKKSALKQIMRKEFGKPYVKTSPLLFSDDDG
jgi:hypothetical protein